jgi:hypothetical protein
MKTSHAYAVHLDARHERYLLDHSSLDVRRLHQMIQHKNIESAMTVATMP